MHWISEAYNGFVDGWKEAAQHHHMPRKAALKQAKSVRENLSEKQIDKMVQDSFPASDPPSTY